MVSSCTCNMASPAESKQCRDKVALEELEVSVSSQSGAVTAAIPSLRLWTVVYSTLTTCLLSLLIGTTVAYSSAALLELKQLEDPELQFDTGLSDIFGASAFIGGIFGGPIGGIVADRLGRKTSLVLNSIPLVSGYFILLSTYLISNGVIFKVLLMFGRFLTGIGVGWVYVAVPVYVGEISPHNLRGVFVIFGELALTIGVVFVLGLGSIPGFHYYLSALVMIGCLVLFISLVLWIPETPRWLLFKKHDQRQAMAALRCLRGPKYSRLDQEIQDIKSTLLEKRPGTFQVVKELLMERSTLIPFLLLLFLFVFQRACGIDIFAAYAGPIFLEAGAANPNLVATFAVGGVNVVTTLVAIILIEFVGRKFLLCAGSAGMFLGSALLGVHFYITRPELCANSTGSSMPFPGEEVACNPHLLPLAIVAVVAFNIGFSLGAGVPFVMLSEYLPLKVRGVAGGVVVAANWATASLLVGSFLSYSEAVGAWTAWWTLAAINFVGFFVIALFFVETKGKKLEEVQDIFKTRTNLCVWKVI